VKITLVIEYNNDNIQIRADLSMSEPKKDDTEDCGDKYMNF
jgi:hypothetical protein